VNFNTLDRKDKDLINYDTGFSNDDVSLLDAAYQALKKGIIIKDAKQALNIVGIRPTIKDNYRFIKKYYGLPWVVFVFLIRILSLKLFTREIIGILSTIGVRRENLFAHYNDISLKQFESKLIQSNPRVSVIIPTLNRYEYLDQCIKDLENQTYKNFELIIVDQSDNFREEFYKGRNIDLKLIRQEEKKLWQARNSAIKISDGNYILLYDDDSIIGNDWIELHLKCIDYFEVAISSGVSLAKMGSKIPVSYSFYRWADQIDTGNVMITREVFASIGLFDEQFEAMRLGDGEFGFRAFLNDIPMISSPEALRIHLKVEVGGLRQMGSWDAFRPTKNFAPKPIPSVVYFYKRYLPGLNYRMAIFIGILLSNIKYSNKKYNSFLILSIVKSILLSPLLLFQFILSKRAANRMLKQGPKIDYYINLK